MYLPFFIILFGLYELTGNIWVSVILAWVLACYVLLEPWLRLFMWFTEKSQTPPEHTAQQTKTSVSMGAKQDSQKTPPSVQPTQPDPALDIQTVVHVTPDEAAHGCTVEVTTGEGEVQVLVQPGTESGTHLKVVGGGNTQGNQAGDLWVRVMVK